jgi:AraC-like DNA-binding protein
MAEWISSLSSADSRPAPGAIGAAGSEPVLAHREICRSGPLDVIRANLTSYFYPARVETLDRGADLSASLLSAVRLNHITLGFLRFGSETMVDPGALGAYHVNVPLSGRVASECGSRQTVATVGQGAVFTPRDHTVLPWWSADSSQVCIKISKVAVEAELEALVGHPVATPIRFDLALDLTTPTAASWLGVVRLLIEDVDRPGGLLERSTAHREHLEKLLIIGLLHLQGHDHLDELLSPQPPARPRTVKRVIDLIEAHPEINYTIAELARHAGVGARRLQIAFQDAVHTSPTGYLRKVKLEHAREDLLNGEESVMAIAYRWGFNHPGRFSTFYRQVYGESPSDTVRRTRGR